MLKLHFGVAASVAKHLFGQRLLGSGILEGLEHFGFAAGPGGLSNSAQWLGLRPQPSPPAFFPASLKTLRTNETAGISLRMYLLFTRRECLGGVWLLGSRLAGVLGQRGDLAAGRSSVGEKSEGEPALSWRSTTPGQRPLS